MLCADVPQVQKKCNHMNSELSCSPWCCGSASGAACSAGHVCGGDDKQPCCDFLLVSPNCEC